jgi:hypothetical protein
MSVMATSNYRRNYSVRNSVGIKRISGSVISRKLVSGKPLSKLSCVCLPLGKLVNGKHFPVNGKQFPVNEKHFPVKGKFGLISKKVFSFYFGQKTLSGSCEKFRNVVLFADYIKFGH